MDSVFIKSVPLLFMLFSLNISYAGQYNETVNIGDSMPVFNLPTIDGNKISSKDIKEPIVVLVSVSSFCPWVRGMDKGLVNLKQQFKPEDVRIIGFSVNLDDDLETMKQHANKSGYNFTYMYDKSQQLGRDLGTTVTPEYFIYNQKRKLVYTGLITNSPAMMTRNGTLRHINGKPTKFYVASAIKTSLAGKIVSPAETRAHGCSTMYQP